LDEIIDHMISACPILSKEQYTKDTIECVHNYTSTYVKKRVQLDNNRWYGYVLKSVETTQGGTARSLNELQGKALFGAPPDLNIRGFV
jgi:hypothetical protein